MNTDFLTIRQLSQKTRICDKFFSVFHCYRVKNKFPLLALAKFMAYQANPEIDTFNANGVKNPN